MSRRRLLPSLVAAQIIALASKQGPPATPTASPSNANVLANEAIIDMSVAKLSEVIIAKTQTSKTHFDLLTRALVEQNSSAAIRGS